jgi:sugar phosphate isomerase/epimerase
MNKSRRRFIETSMMASVAVGIPSLVAASPKSPFKISLAEWSINKSLFSGKVDHLDFPKLARKHGISAVEYVNQFFMDKAEDATYLNEMKKRAESEGVRSVLIMCDREGSLGDVEKAKRNQTVENHKKWIHAAKFLGCHSIRVNGYSSVKWSSEESAFNESQKLVADGLRQLCEIADGHSLNVLIENHGGFSSNAKWLSGVMKMADHPRAGTLPDFGNFRIHRTDEGKVISYDTYRGVRELMPFAKGVSLKVRVWDDHGNSKPLDYEKMMRVVLDAGFRGYCGIEHGEPGREWESIVEVRRKLEAVRARLGESYQ